MLANTLVSSSLPLAVLDLIDRVDVDSGFLDHHPDDVEPHLVRRHVERRSTPAPPFAVRDRQHEVGLRRVQNFLEEKSMIVILARIFDLMGQSFQLLR